MAGPINCSWYARLLRLLMPPQQPPPPQRHGGHERVADDGDLDDAGEYAARVGEAGGLHHGAAEAVAAGTVRNRRLPLLFEYFRKISPLMEHACDFNAVRLQTIENNVWMAEDRAQPRRHLVTRPPHERAIRQMLACLRDFAKHVVGKLRRCYARIVPPDTMQVLFGPWRPYNSPTFFRHVRHGLA